MTPSRRALLAASAALAGASWAGRATATLVPEPSRDRLATGGEATGYARASTYAEVLRMLDDLDRRGAPIFRDTLGTSVAGRDIAYAVVSRPRVETPAAAKALGRPIVLLVAALHGNEVDGTDALLAMTRDLCIATTKTLLEELVLVVVPVANPDGLEALGPQAERAPEQNGPERTGTLPNGAGIDLDGDFTMLAAPETRGLVDLVNRWQPDVFADLRTFGASFADYGATYAPSLHPAAFVSGPLARDRVLPAVSDALRARFGIASFPAGHFGRDVPLPVPPPAGSPVFGWFPLDFRVRRAANYFGVRGLVAVTGASYGHDPFEHRALCARAFVECLLAFCADHPQALGQAAARLARPADGAIPVRAVLPPAAPERVVDWEQLALDAGPDREPGVPEGLKRSGLFAKGDMPVYDRYLGTLEVPRIRGWLVSPDAAAGIATILERHGIAHHLNRRSHDFTIRRFGVAPGASGWGEPFATTSDPGTLVVSCAQPLGALAAIVLEPESDDTVSATDPGAAGSFAAVARIEFGPEN